MRLVSFKIGVAKHAESHYIEGDPTMILQTALPEVGKKRVHESFARSDWHYVRRYGHCRAEEAALIGASAAEWYGHGKRKTRLCGVKLGRQ